MRISIKATPDYHFEAKSENGSLLQVGASSSIGGDESGFRPMQLLLAAFGTCSAIDAVLILKKGRVDFSHIDIEVDGDRKTGTPSPYETIRLRFIVHGKDVDLQKAERAVKLSVEKYCSVGASLDPNIKIEVITEVAP